MSDDGSNETDNATKPFTSTPHIAGDHNKLIMTPSVAAPPFLTLINVAIAFLQYYPRHACYPSTIINLPFLSFPFPTLINFAAVLNTAPQHSEPNIAFATRALLPSAFRPPSALSSATCSAIASDPAMHQYSATWLLHILASESRIPPRVPPLAPLQARRSATCFYIRMFHALRPGCVPVTRSTFGHGYW